MSADNWTECPVCGGGAFREDYEIGMYKGFFIIEYKGECMKCGYEYRYQHQEEINRQQATKKE